MTHDQINQCATIEERLNNKKISFDKATDILEFLNNGKLSINENRRTNTIEYPFYIYGRFDKFELTILVGLHKAKFISKYTDGSIKIKEFLI